MLSAIIAGLLIGMVFGVALDKSRMIEPGAIVRQMQLRNFLMVKVFLTASATSVLVIGIMHSYFDLVFHLKPFFVWSRLVGGALLGVGITLAGACPGTVYGQIGAGYKDALLVFLGGLLGASVFGFIKQPWLDPTFFSDRTEMLQLNDWLGLSHMTTALLVAGAFVGILVLLEWLRGWRLEVGQNFDGL
jgi:uncharacterized protein